MMSFALANHAECHDGIDNDGDGRIDALVNLDPDNGQTWHFEENKNPWYITGLVRSNIQAKGFPYSPPALHPLLGYTGGTGSEPDNWNEIFYNNNNIVLLYFLEYNAKSQLKTPKLAVLIINK